MNIQGVTLFKCTDCIEIDTYSLHSHPDGGLCNLRMCHVTDRILKQTRAMWIIFYEHPGRELPVQ